MISSEAATLTSWAATVATAAPAALGVPHADLVSENRSNIWREMRTLCAAAHVEPHKVFPHNFRHLFAVSYYRMAKDVAKLADLLGHASIDTTRIYIMESGAEHERQMEKLGLVV